MLIHLPTGHDAETVCNGLMAVDAAGRRVGKPLTAKSDATLIVALLRWIRSITGDTDLAWAVGDGHGFARASPMACC